MSKQIFTEEYCANCERESTIRVTVAPVPRCKYCKAELVPCSACEQENCEGCFHGSNFSLHPDYHK
jgi:hypothetical protein